MSCCFKWPHFSHWRARKLGSFSRALGRIEWLKRSSVMALHGHWQWQRQIDGKPSGWNVEAVGDWNIDRSHRRVRANSTRWNVHRVAATRTRMKRWCRRIMIDITGWRIIRNRSQARYTINWFIACTQRRVKLSYGLYTHKQLNTLTVRVTAQRSHVILTQVEINRLWWPRQWSSIVTSTNSIRTIRHWAIWFINRQVTDNRFRRILTL